MLSQWSLFLRLEDYLFNEEILKTKQTENNKAFIAMLDIDQFISSPLTGTIA